MVFCALRRTTLRRQVVRGGAQVGLEVADADGADLFSPKLQAAFAGVELRLGEHDYALSGGDWRLNGAEHFRIGHDGD